MTLTSPDERSSSVLRFSDSPALPSGEISSPSTRIRPLTLATLPEIFRQLASIWIAPNESLYLHSAPPLGFGGPNGSSPVVVPGGSRAHSSRCSRTRLTAVLGAWRRTFQRPDGGVFTVASAEVDVTAIDSLGSVLPTARTLLSGRISET